MSAFADQLLKVSCCMGNDACICGQDERVLRAYIRREKALDPMSPAQRKWCVNEITSVEGYYGREEYAVMSDSVLASTVLDAWTSFCRDKGLL